MPQRIDLHALVSGWPVAPAHHIPTGRETTAHTDEEWRVAPADLHWIGAGSLIYVQQRVYADDLSEVRIGNGVFLGFGARIGKGVALGDDVTIERHCDLGNSVYVGSRTYVGQYVSLGSGVNVRMDVAIGASTHVSQATEILQKVVIGRSCVIGYASYICDGAELADETELGNGARVGPGSKGAIDLGQVDGYRKVLSEVNGVAHISAGCRWFTLADAIDHWQPHDDEEDERRDTRDMMNYAVTLAKRRGWRIGSEPAVEPPSVKQERPEYIDTHELDRIRSQATAWSKCFDALNGPSPKMWERSVGGLTGLEMALAEIKRLQQRDAKLQAVEAAMQQDG